MAYQIYRQTTIGKLLLDSLKEVTSQYYAEMPMQFFAEFKKNILDEFDRAMHDGFSALIQGKKITFQAGNVDGFSRRDDVWTIFLSNIVVSLVNGKQLIVDNLKIVAADRKVGISQGRPAQLSTSPFADNEDLVENLNKWVIDQVITKVGPTLLDGFVQDVKTAWQSKLAANMALQMIPDTSPSASSSAGTTSQPAAASGGEASNGSAATSTDTRMVTIHIMTKHRPEAFPLVIPAHTLRAGASHVRLAEVLQSPSVRAAFALPDELATKTVQQLVDTALNSDGLGSGSGNGIAQVDGQDDDTDDDGGEVDEVEDQGSADEISLNSDDDVEDPPPLVETDNLMVCQWKKIHKQGKTWEFKFENVLLNFNGKDYVFQKVDGSAKW